MSNSDEEVVDSTEGGLSALARDIASKGSLLGGQICKTLESVTLDDVIGQSPSTYIKTFGDQCKKFRQEAETRLFETFDQSLFSMFLLEDDQNKVLNNQSTEEENSSSLSDTSVTSKKDTIFSSQGSSQSSIPNLSLEYENAENFEKFKTETTVEEHHRNKEIPLLENDSQLDYYDSNEREANISSSVSCQCSRSNSVFEDKCIENIEEQKVRITILEHRPNEKISSPITSSECDSIITYGNNNSSCSSINSQVPFSQLSLEHESTEIFEKFTTKMVFHEKKIPSPTSDAELDCYAFSENHINSCSSSVCHETFSNAHLKHESVEYSEKSNDEFILDKNVPYPVVVAESDCCTSGKQDQRIQGSDCFQRVIADKVVDANGASLDEFEDIDFEDCWDNTVLDEIVLINNRASAKQSYKKYLMKVVASKFRLTKDKKDYKASLNIGTDMKAIFSYHANELDLSCSTDKHSIESEWELI